MGIRSNSFQLSDLWVEAIRPVCNAQGYLNYEEFSRLALFHETLGYYRRETVRVGKSADRDFYTSSSHSRVFPDLVLAACEHLLANTGLPISSFEFCEIGAEPGVDPWKERTLPFAGYRILRLGQAFEIPEFAVLYSNELFDAQPFHRWLAQDGKWHPIHLRLQGNQLSEVIASQPLTESEVRAAARLPKAPAMEYHLDWSSAASELMQDIVNASWNGLLLAFDYGMTWKQRIEETPQGTARAYRSHKQVETLFDDPGAQDLTTHVCWDALSAVLENAGFRSIRIHSQSRFFLEHAAPTLQQIITASNTLTDPRKGQLLELISPGFFGQKFQVLSALRGEIRTS